MMLSLVAFLHKYKMTPSNNEYFYKAAYYMLGSINNEMKLLNTHYGKTTLMFHSHICGMAFAGAISVTNECNYNLDI